jgi:hypothetical protein
LKATDEKRRFRIRNPVHGSKDTDAYGTIKCHGSGTLDGSVQVFLVAYIPDLCQAKLGKVNIPVGLLQNYNAGIHIRKKHAVGISILDFFGPGMIQIHNQAIYNYSFKFMG